MQNYPTREIALPRVHHISNEISRLYLSSALFLLIIPYILGICWPTPTLTYIALLTPPIACLIIGVMSPSAGIGLGLAILPLLTVEVAIEAERSISVAKLTLLTIIAIWIFSRRLKPFSNPPIILHWVIFLSALLVSSIFNGLSFPILWHLAESVIALLIFVAITEIIRDETERHTLLYLLALSGSIVIMLWFIQKGFLYWGSIEIPLVLRVGISQSTSIRNSSTLAQPNYFGAYCILLGSIYFSLIINKSKLIRIGLATAGIITWLIPIWVGSTGTMVSLVVAIIAGGIIFPYKPLKASSLLVIFLLAATISGAIFFQNHNFSSLKIDSNSVVIRKYAFLMGYRSWLDNPLLGTGPGTFEEEFIRAESNYTGPKLIAMRLPARSLAAHNGYLRHLVEIGTLGLGAFLWLICALFYQMWNKLRHNGIFDLYLFLGLVAFSINAVFEDVFSYSVLWVIFWSMNAIMLTTYKSDTSA